MGNLLTFPDPSLQRPLVPTGGAGKPAVLPPRRARRCLWIAREMPFPLLSGDRVYSAGLVQALARTGMKVVFVAQREGSPQAWLPSRSPVRWIEVDEAPRPPVRVALTSPLPLAAGIRSAPVFQRTLRALLRKGFDAVVLDHLGSGWALDVIESMPGPRPALLYLAHNHERVVWASMASANRQTWPRRLAIHRNADKVARLEAKLLRAVDRVVAITDSDARGFEADGAPRPVTVITPGYSGQRQPPRQITAATERRVVMVGSFSWIIKQENLRQFLAIADQRFHAAGIQFDVIGQMPPALALELGATLRATTLHGFVADLGPIFRRARLAVVPELIGGGFKLKLLDYLFGRVPIATIGAAIAGLPDALGPHLLLADDMPTLVDRIVAGIDDVARLDAAQRAAHDVVARRYRWDERGQTLNATLESLIVEREARRAR